MPSGSKRVKRHQAKGRPHANHKFFRVRPVIVFFFDVLILIVLHNEVCMVIVIFLTSSMTLTGLYTEDEALFWDPCK